MSTTFELQAETREVHGTRASRKNRRAGKVPAVLYGAGKDPAHLMLDHDQILHNLENESFHAAILTVKTSKDSDQAILRDVQMHPHKPQVMHVDLQRVSATEKLHIKVPVHFVGEDIAPGVKLQSGIVSHQMTEVDISCLPSNLPEYLEADVSELNMHESVHLSDLKLPDGVEITALSHGGDDQAVATVVAVRGAAEEEEEAAVEEEGEAAAEAEAETKEE
jgi:large subunit ribosomal protein L25